MKLIKRIILVVLALLLLVGGGGVFAVYRTFLVPTGNITKPIVVEIKQGYTLTDVARLLKKEGVIYQEKLFITAAKYLGMEKSIKVGEYEIGPDTSPKDALIMLYKGRVIEYFTTIPEGLNIFQVADLLGKRGFVDKDKFLRLLKDKDFIASLSVDAQSLEGYLFPDTYTVNKSMNEKQIIEMMVKRFFVVFGEEKEKRKKDTNLTDYEVLTLASIVEKETSAPQERELVSAVFMNRRAKDMKFDSCATVIYGIWDRFDGNLTENDLKTLTPYNTYLNAGFPPTPICSPGRAAIAAAFNPADVDYLYFVSKNDGTSYFSSTLSEHNRAVYEYQILREHRK